MEEGASHPEVSFLDHRLQPWAMRRERQAVRGRWKERGLANVARGRFAVRPPWAEEVRCGHRCRASG